MAETSVTQLILSINEMLGSISRIHEDEVTRLKNENAILAAQAKSAQGSKAQKGTYTSEASDLSLSPKHPVHPALEPWMEKAVISTCNSRRCSGSTRAETSSRRESGSRRPSSISIMGRSLSNPSADNSHRLGDDPTASQGSRNSTELRAVQIAARLRYVQQMRADLPGRMSATSEGSAESDLNAPTPESSEDEAILPETLDNESDQKSDQKSDQRSDTKDSSPQKTRDSSPERKALERLDPSGWYNWPSQGNYDSFIDDDSLELCAVWKERKRGLGRIARRAFSHQKTMTVMESQPARQPWQAMPVQLHIRIGKILHKLWQRMVARPSSKRRLLWDFMGMLLIGYDVIVIPLSAFEPPPNVFTQMMAWACTLYWTFDIPCTVLVGYHTKGVLEMRPLRIASHYLHTWFIFDIGVVAVDWMCAVAENSIGSAVEGGRVGYLRFGRFGRFLRMLRLLRLLKLHGMIVDIFERIHSEVTRIMFGIVGIVTFIVLINHVLACGWYWVGTNTYEAGHPSWVSSAELAGRTMAYNYTTSVHWSLTQFTPASMEVVPKNAFERSYTVCTLLFAMCIFSSFVSSITNAMTRLRNLNGDNLEKATVLRQYLKENRIPGEVCNRIFSWLQYTEDTSKHRIHEPQVAILPTLPALLQTELQNSIYKPLLDKHPWFKRFADTHSDGMRRFYTCISDKGLVVGKELFHSGQVADRMWFIFSGHLRYLRDDELQSPQSWDLEKFQDVVARYKADTEEVKVNEPVIIGPGQWASEHPLWIHWHHVGNLVGLGHCELFAIKAQKFQELMQYELTGAWQAAKYARAFYQYLSWSQVGLSDVWSDNMVLDDMASRSFTLTEDDAPSSSSGESSHNFSPLSSQRNSRYSGSDQQSITKSLSEFSRSSGRSLRRSFGTPSQVALPVIERSDVSADATVSEPGSPVNLRQSRRRSDSSLLVPPVRTSRRNNS